MALMFRCALKLVLLVAVVFNLAGAAQALHDHEADESARDVQTTSSARATDGGSQQPTDSPRHPAHNHEQCVVCHLLAAPGIHELPGSAILLCVFDTPTRIRQISTPAPHRVFVATPIDARGPPHAPHA